MGPGVRTLGFPGMVAVAVLLASTPADAGGAARGKRVTKAAWKLVTRPIRRASEKQIGEQEGRLADVRARAFAHERATIFGPLHGRLDKAEGKLQQARTGNPFKAKKNLTEARETIDAEDTLLRRYEGAAAPPAGKAPPPRVKSRALGLFGRRGQKTGAGNAERETGRVEHDSWMTVMLTREPTRTRSPFDYKLSNFRPRSGPDAHNRGDSVKGIGARALWVDAEVALVRTDTGPDIFLPTRELDAASRDRLASGGKIVVDVVYHPTGGVVATRPRLDD